MDTAKAKGTKAMIVLIDGVADWQVIDFKGSTHSLTL